MLNALKLELAIACSAVWNIRKGDRVRCYDSALSKAANAVSDLPLRQPLPEFQGISQWLNSNPLKVEALKENVVLIQFWTFSCINCQRTLP